MAAKKTKSKKQTETIAISQPSPVLTESGRTVAYSDAIFSIALTLMALEIKIPTPEQIGSKNLLVALGEAWPAYLSFLISFMIITVVWTNHHTIFRYVKYVDHNLTILNNLLLLNIIIIPFCSEMLGEYILLDNENSKIAALIYGGWIALGGIPFNLVWRYGVKKEYLRNPDADIAEIEMISKHFIKGPYIYSFVTILAFINVWLSIAGFVILILMYLVPTTWLFRKRKPA
ncbi:TMEM175 family protein [Leptospira venezuelensis]|uniref:TMEM175 family protein n=1 Tax=Leptospira venezuelensis TaxID=1958811 RepID=UPI000A3CD8DD|nr:TMEM175 family protein [Leptospira venezuelensis]